MYTRCSGSHSADMIGLYNVMRDGPCDVHNSAMPTTDLQIKTAYLFGSTRRLIDNTKVLSHTERTSDTR